MFIFNLQGCKQFIELIFIEAKKNKEESKDSKYFEWCNNEIRNIFRYACESNG